MDAERLKTQLGDGKTGTYVLCMRLDRDIDLTIGKLGRFNFAKGYYYYTGSAFGPGGIAARCKHHINISSKPRWHIDYLRKHCQLSEIIFSTHSKHLECHWAKILQEYCTLPIKNFGASDCNCHSHLFYSETFKNPEKYLNQVTGYFKNRNQS